VSGRDKEEKIRKGGKEKRKMLLTCFGFQRSCGIPVGGGEKKEERGKGALFTGRKEGKKKGKRKRRGKIVISLQRCQEKEGKPQHFANLDGGREEGERGGGGKELFLPS